MIPHRSCLAFLVLALSCLSRTNAADPTFPKMSELFSMFYQTDVQLTDVGRQLSAFAKEFYDNSQTRGRVDLLAFGDRKTILYYGNTKEILEVNATSCLASDEELSIYYDMDIFYGWLHKDPLIIGPSALLWFAQGKDSEYLGKQEARGITCDAFRINVTDERNDVSYYYYFTDADWTTPYKESQFKAVPVRVVVSGMTSRDVDDRTLMHPVTQMVDFAYFRPSIKDWLSFQPDTGLGCYGKLSEMTMPNISKEFKFSAESFDILNSETHEDVDVNFYRLWFNGYLQLARMDAYTKTSAKLELYDFNTGVIYGIIDGRECKIKPLRYSRFEGQEKLVGYLKTPEEVLGLTGDFYYMGERYMRGIKCRVFESVQRDVNYNNEDLYQLVTTVYFSTDFTEVVNEGEDLKYAPIYMKVTGYKERNKVSLKMQFNIFGYDDVVGTTVYKDFPIASCFPLSQQKTYFIMLFPVGAKIAAKFEENNELFIDMLRSQIMLHTNVSDLRVPLLKADYDSSGIYVTGLLLDRPPALSQFWLLSIGEAHSSTLIRIVAEAKTQEQCAYACVDQTAFDCKGFHFCNNVCFVNEMDISESTEDTADLGVCEIYIRAERNSNNKEPYLDKALQLLNDAVTSKQFIVDLYISDADTSEIRPTEIILGDGPFNKKEDEKAYNLVFNGFQLPAAADSETSLERFDSTTENECYKSCKDEKSLLCSSFSYCPDATNKMCIISSALIVGGKGNYDDVVANKYCNVYAMKYLDYYDAYPGKVVLIPGEKSFDKIKSTEECAMKCRTESGFYCRGFEYCQSKKSCVLHSKHILDLKSGDTSSSKGTQCVHYAAKYSADYLDMGESIIDDDSNTRGSISLQECARVCSEEMSSCKSFNYCPARDEYSTDSTCQPTSKTLADKGVKIITKGNCHHYTKREHVEDWGSPKKPPKKTGYTTKGFVGLVIGMLFFGLIVGVLCFVGYSFYRSRRGDDGMTVRFMKQTNS